MITTNYIITSCNFKVVVSTFSKRQIRDQIANTILSALFVVSNFSKYIS